MSFNLAQCALETAIGQTQKAATIHANLPSGPRLREIAAELERLREPEVVSEYLRRHLRKIANARAAA